MYPPTLNCVITVKIMKSRGGNLILQRIINLKALVYEKIQKCVRVIRRTSQKYKVLVFVPNTSKNRFLYLKRRKLGPYFCLCFISILGLLSSPRLSIFNTSFILTTMVKKSLYVCQFFIYGFSHNDFTLKRKKNHTQSYYPNTF